jgi:hypothetical protein
MLAIWCRLVPFVALLHRVHVFFVCFVQAAILLGVGAQCVTMDTLSARLDLPVNQLLAYFNKALRKISNALIRIQVRCLSVFCCHLHSCVAMNALQAPYVVVVHVHLVSVCCLLSVLQEASVSAELDAVAAKKPSLSSGRADPVASFEDAAWEAALAPISKKAKDSGDVPAILSVKKLVPAVSPAAARMEREDVDDVTAKQKHHKSSHKKRKADE